MKRRGRGKLRGHDSKKKGEQKPQNASIKEGRGSKKKTEELEKRKNLKP